MTPEYLNDYIEKIRILRHDMLCNDDAVGFDPFAEQHFLLALNVLDDAVRHLKLAQLFQVRAIAQRGR